MIKCVCPLYRASLSFSDSLAFISRDGTYTYRELNLMTENTARLLHLLKEKLNNSSAKRDLLLNNLTGIIPSTFDAWDPLFPKIMIKAKPEVTHILMMFACLRTGITYIPYSPKETEDRITAVSAEAMAPVINSPKEFLNSLGALFSGENCSGTDSDTPENREENSPDGPVTDASAPCNMMMTSGSTALPKLVVHNLNAHIKSALGGQQVLKIKASDRYLLSLPLNHVGGQAVIFKCVLAGAAMTAPRRDMTTDEQIRRDGITVLSLVPTQLVRILNSKGEQSVLNGVRAVLLGGAPIEASLITAAHEAYPDTAFYGSYGSTEMASQICTAELHGAGNITAGFPLPYRELLINDDGEILVRGETLSMGYFRKGRIEPLTENDGYFHTGDIGGMLPDGLIIRGRKDNMFISGGENIHPEQVEAMLLKNTNIEKILVVPVSHGEWGKMAVALVRTKKDFKGSFEDLRQQALKEISHVYVPKVWLEMPEIENTGLKINRRKYIEHAERLLGKNNGKS